MIKNDQKQILSNFYLLVSTCMSPCGMYVHWLWLHMVAYGCVITCNNMLKHVITCWNMLKQFKTYYSIQAAEAISSPFTTRPYTDHNAPRHLRVNAKLTELPLENDWQSTNCVPTAQIESNRWILVGNTVTGCDAYLSNVTASYTIGLISNVHFEFIIV